MDNVYYSIVDFLKYITTHYDFIIGFIGGNVIKACIIKLLKKSKKAFNFLEWLWGKDLLRIACAILYFIMSMVVLYKLYPHELTGTADFLKNVYSGLLLAISFGILFSVTVFFTNPKK